MDHNRKVLRRYLVLLQFSAIYTVETRLLNRLEILIRKFKRGPIADYSYFWTLLNFLAFAKIIIFSQYLFVP